MLSTASDTQRISIHFTFKTVSAVFKAISGAGKPPWALISMIKDTRSSSLCH